MCLPKIKGINCEGEDFMTLMPCHTQIYFRNKCVWLAQKFLAYDIASTIQMSFSNNFFCVVQVGDTRELLAKGQSAQKDYENVLSSLASKLANLTRDR